MRSRPVLMIAVMALVAACGGGDSDGAEPTIPDITLLPTTSEPILFEEVESSVEPASTVPTSTEPITTEIAGESTTTTVPATEATTAPVVTDPVPVDADTAPGETGFVLGAGGLDAVPFGAEPEQTITFVTSVLGAPTADTGWIDPFEIGPCGGDRIRQVNWSQLQLEFADVSDVATGRDHFYAFYYGVEGTSTPQPAGLETAEGIGAGATVSDVIAAYPNVTLLQGDEFIGPSFAVNDNLTGRLSGITEADVVEMIIGGRPCDG